MAPVFPTDLSAPVSNYLTGSTCYLRRVDEVPATDAMLEQMVAIGNEPEVYTWLFREMLNGQPYELENARDFFDMGNDGWENNDKFVFLLLTEDGSPAACIDIKSADPDYAEIGYLSSIRHRGVMTNTVVALAALAKEAGFKTLFGRSKKDNTASSRVMIRAGFMYHEEKSKVCERYEYFELGPGIDLKPVL